MTERRIEAGIHAGAQLFREAGAGGADKGGTPAEPNQQDRSRFEQAMHAPSPSEPQAPAPATAPPSPFSLFGAVAPAPSLPPAPRSGFPDAAGLLQRLMVSRDGENAQVRMELDEDHLPGVTVSLYEDKGLLTVEFVCRNEEPRRLLNQAAAALAQEMADNLNRPVIWCVMTDDEEDRCRYEVQGNPK
ncbi:flagellar hook-length control protein FliK [Noviherbaspirillum sp. CPCC 100848]|uniref:Flagellar hook-length control protein FliK n=1 Tax=Noviherbaspirillum album TaxID=3080276 RepID=A0ABU6JBB6_9BURK|nr:type III secretion HpaP family protein [Noviherbaspirillum sp. CPCC 100848]MEC4720723.1 flagellar hook-length control protein FliK [Noviherbaspirillum sp. CPCC 100848]